MGAIVSKELVSPFDAFGNWKYEEAVQMQNEYKEKDYDFGIDHSVIQQLCKAVRKNIPSSLGQDILKSFSKSNSGIINALSLIGGVILVSQHSDNGTVVSQKSEAIFDAFDFEGEGDISLDEMTICLLSVLRAVSVMTGRESEPTDQGMEELCLEAFGQFQLDAQDYIQKGQFAKWAASKVDATTSATGILKTFELLDKEARTRRNSRMTPRNGGAPYDGVDAKSQPVDAAEVQRFMSQTAPSRLPTPVAQGGGAGLPAAASSSSNFTYQAPSMAQLKAVATKYQQRLPQPGDPRYYRKAGTGGGEAPGLKAPVAVPAKARKASVHKSEPVFVSHKKEGAAISAGAYQPRAGLNPAAVYQAPTIAQLKAVGTKYVQRLPQAGDRRYYQKAAIQKQPAASASEFVFEMEAGQAGDESFNPATQSVVEEPVAAEVQKEMAKDRPVTAPSYKARAGLNPASVYQAPGMAQLKAVATKYQQRLPQPGDPRYYRKAGAGGGEVPGLKAPVAVPAKARKASVHKSEPVFVSHKKEGAASSAGAYQPRAGLNLAAVYQAPSIAQLKAVGSKYALRLPQPGDRRFYQKAKATAAAGAAATTMVPVQAFADRKASLAPTLGPAPVAGATHVAAAAAALPSVVPLKPQPSRRDPFPRGLPVTANFCGLGWRSAKVLSVNANGTLNLLYTHGAKEVYVSTKVVGPPFSSFISHQVYTTMKPPLQLSSMRSTPSHIVSTPSLLTVAPLKNSCEPKSFRTPDGKVWYSSFVSHQTYQPPQRPSGPKSFQTPDGKVWYSSFVSHQTYQPPQKPSGPKSFRTPDGKVWYSSFVSHQTYQPPQKPSEPQSFRTPDGKVWYSSFVSHQTYCATKLPARSNEYTVGLPVTANFCGLGWRSAKVAEVNPNGTLNLLYTHGAKEVHVSKKAVRPPFSSFVSHQVYTTVKPLAVAPLKKSEEPKSFCTPDGKVWYSSFVSHQTYCASKLPACSNEYTVGLPVTANFCGLGWRSAKVVEVNPNGTLNLLYTHGAKEVHVSKKVVRPPFSSFVSHQVYTTVKPPLHRRMMRSTPSHIVSMPSSLNAAPLKLVR